MARRALRVRAGWLTLVTAASGAFASGCGALGPGPSVVTAPHSSATATRAPAETVPAPSTPAATGTAPAAAAPLTDAGPVSDGASSVSVEGPTVDAPGALLPLVVTARGTTDAVKFTIAAAGDPGTCEGQQWRHPEGLSQKCWVTLPQQPGDVTVTAYADVAGAGGVSHRSALGSYHITAKGPIDRAVSQGARDQITTCGNASGHVWLTFDDGFASMAGMRAVIDTLTQHNVKGRFFAVGSWARANPQMVAEIRRQGHIIQNHTRDHKLLNTLDDAALHAQIAQGPQSDAPKLLRPGYGAGAYTERVRTTAGSLGYQVCYWTVDPNDWAKASAQQITSRVMNGDHKTPPVNAGGVVLLHMTGASTAQALPGLIAAVRAKGLTLDPLR